MLPILLLLFASAAGKKCLFQDRAYSELQTWRAELTDFISGEPGQFDYRCSLDGSAILTACYDAVHDAVIPFRTSRNFPVDHTVGAGVEQVTCGKGFGKGTYYLRRRQLDVEELTCRDSGRATRANNEEWLDEDRHVLKRCVAKSRNSFRIIDVACQHPKTGTLQPLESVTVDGVKYRCTQFRNKRYDKLIFSSIRLQKETAFSTAKPSIVFKISPELEQNVEHKLEDPTRCYFQERVHDIGSSFDSEDGSVKLRCVGVDGEAKLRVHSCLTPSGSEVPMGTGIYEGESLYRCVYAADGSVSREETRGRAGVVEQLCRSSDAAVAAVKEENKAIVKRNQELVTRSITKEDEAVFYRAVRRRNRHSLQRTKFYDIISQFERVKAVPVPLCQWKACSGRECWSGPGGYVVRVRGCRLGDCAFNDALVHDPDFSLFHNL